MKTPNAPATASTEPSKHGTPTPSQPAKVAVKRKVGKLPALLAVAGLMSVLTCLFGLLNDALLPQIRLWPPHLVTIALTGVVAAIVTAFLFRINERTQERLYQLSRAVEQSPVSIMITDKAGNIEYVNPKFSEVTGYSAEEVLGRNPRILKSGKMPQEDYKRLWETIASGREWRGEFHNRKKNGKLFWESASISPILDDASRIGHFLAVKEDITMRKKEERQLAEALDFNRRIISDVPSGIAVYKASGECVMANEAAARMIQTNVPQMLKQNFRQLESWRVSGLLEMAEKTLATQKSRQGEFHHISTFGKEVWFVGHFSCFVRNDESHLLLTLNDITERKRAEKALQLFQFVTNQAAVAVFWTNQEGGIYYVNEQACCSLGYTREELMRLHVFDIIPSLSKEHWEENWNQLDDKQFVKQQFETTHRRKNGSTFPVEVIARRLSTDDVALRVAFVRDITERKQAEETLIRSEEYFRALTENAKDIISVINPDGAVRYLSPSVEKLLGFTPQELVGRSVFDLVHPEDQPHAQQIFSEGITVPGLAVQEQFRLRHKGGSWRILEITAQNLIQNPSVKGVIMNSRDITERKQAEEKVREQAALLDHAQDAIWVMDANERISYWNKSAERIYGWNAAEAIGKDPVKLLFKGTMTPQLKECIQALKGRGEWSGELEEFAKDGNRVITRRHSNVIRDEHGRLKAALFISTDITEKKKLEAQFLRTQRMDSLGALAGGIAHDLNNVLTPLMFSVQMLKQKITDADGQKLLHALESSVERGAKLVKQVLTFGRGIQGERVSVQPAHLIREIKQIIQETFPKSLEFECDCPAGLWTVTGDPTQLYQVLLNLCVNARDAMPHGGKLSIRLRNLMLDQDYSRINPGYKPGPFVVFEVTDTGTGIPKEIQDRIFDPFFTTKSPGEGTGLGLSTTLGIVRSHGGSINCYSESGKGSTFKVCLPANVVPMAAENAAVKHTKLPHGRGELVLLVDDETSIREVAQKTLERFGYRILLAANGAEAVSLYTARRDEIAVVVTDMAMPVMDGPATIAVLQSINPGVKIIGSSGFGPRHVAPQTNGNDTGHFIPKPYSTETMLHALDKVLHGAAPK